MLIVLIQPARAELGAGLQPSNRLVIHPYLEVGVEYDSDAQLATTSARDILREQERESDTSIRLRPGVDFFHTHPRLTSRTEIWTDAGRSLESSDLDEDAYGYQQFLRGGGEIISVNLLHGFQHAVDGQTGSNFDQGTLTPAEDIRDRSERDQFNAELELSRSFAIDVNKRTTSIVQAGVSYGYDQADFRDESRSDIGTHNGGLHLSVGVSHTAALLIDYEIATEDSHDFDDPSYSHILQTGYRNRIGEQISWQITAGYQLFDPAIPRADSSAPVEDQGDTTLATVQDLEGFSYNAELTGQINQRLALQLAANNYIETTSFGAEANPRTVNIVSVALSHQTTERFALSLTGSYRNDDLEHPTQTANGLVNADTRSLFSGVTGTFTPSSWMKGIARIGYETREGDLPSDEVDRATLSLRVRVTY
jgi:hypothetical protein